MHKTLQPWHVTLVIQGLLLAGGLRRPLWHVEWRAVAPLIPSAAQNHLRTPLDAPFHAWLPWQTLHPQPKFPVTRRWLAHCLWKWILWCQLVMAMKLLAEPAVYWYPQHAVRQGLQKRTGQLLTRLPVKECSHLACNAFHFNSSQAFCWGVLIGDFLQRILRFLSPVCFLSQCTWLLAP
jgi:hypothetical protein